MYAAWSGQLEILKWFRSEGLSDIKAELSGAVRMSHLDILEWLNCWRIEEHFLTIVREGPPEVVKWLLKKTPERKQDIINLLRKEKRSSILFSLSKSS